jgi:hypothetical protein
MGVQAGSFLKKKPLECRLSVYGNSKSALATSQSRNRTPSKAKTNPRGKQSSSISRLPQSIFFVDLSVARPESMSAQNRETLPFSSWFRVRK